MPLHFIKKIKPIAKSYTYDQMAVYHRKAVSEKMVLSMTSF